MSSNRSIIYIIVIIYYTIIVENMSARTVIQSAAISIISFFIVRVLLLDRLRSIAVSKHFLAITFLAQGVFFALYAMFGLAIPLSNTFTPTMQQTLLFLFVFVVSFFYTFGFIYHGQSKGELRIAGGQRAF
jgi:hypothetical protein